MFYNFKEAVGDFQQSSTPWYVTTSSYSEQNPNGFADEGAQSYDSWNLHTIQVTFDFWNTWPSSHGLKKHDTNDAIKNKQHLDLFLVKYNKEKKRKILFAMRNWRMNDTLKQREI